MDTAPPIGVCAEYQPVPGFLTFSAVQGRQDEADTISIVETQAGAEESIRQAAHWVAKKGASLLQGLPERMGGPARASRGPVSSPVNSLQPIPASLTKRDRSEMLVGSAHTNGAGENNEHLSRCGVGGYAVALLMAVRYRNG